MGLWSLPAGPTDTAGKGRSLTRTDSKVVLTGLAELSRMEEDTCCENLFGTCG